MSTLYVAQQGCYVTLQQEQLLIKRKNAICQQVQLPLVDQILVFGHCQLTTQALRACLQRQVPVLYLSRMGQCYGRLLPITQGYRQLARHQQDFSAAQRLRVAKILVKAKLWNSRVMLQRQGRTRPTSGIELAVEQLAISIRQVNQARDHAALMGIEGAGAAAYFAALGDCFVQPGFTFTERNRRPPKDPVNALLSFGYQVLWNHLYSLIEAQNLDPYEACLHQGSRKHAALTSDLLEPFRAPLVDSLVLYLVNRKIMNPDTDFEPQKGGCYLNDSGRRKYLQAFVARMETEITSSSPLPRPRWDLLTAQVQEYKRFVYEPDTLFKPYLIR